MTALDSKTKIQQESANVQNIPSQLKPTDGAMVISMKQEDIKRLCGNKIKINKLQFQDKVFVKGPSFSKQAKQSAIDFCRQCRMSKVSCLFVERDAYFTIWLQQI